MENVIFVEVETLSGKKTDAIITNLDGSVTGMTKAHYEAQQVEHLTEIVLVSE